MAWAETDSMTEKGVMGVCVGSVCASVQNMGVGGGEMTHKPSWTLCEQLIQSQLLSFYSLSFSHLL